MLHTVQRTVVQLNSIQASVDKAHVDVHCGGVLRNVSYRTTSILFTTLSSPLVARTK